MIHVCIHTCIHTSIHTYMHRRMHTWVDGTITQMVARAGNQEVILHLSYLSRSHLTINNVCQSLKDIFSLFASLCVHFHQPSPHSLHFSSVLPACISPNPNINLLSYGGAVILGMLAVERHPRHTALNASIRRSVRDSCDHFPCSSPSGQSNKPSTCCEERKINLRSNRN